MDEPFGGKIRRCTDRQDTGALALHQAVGAHRDPIQGVADHREILAARRRHDQPLTLAVEEPDAERRLQRLDLMADRTLGDAKLFGGPREALAARRGFEGLESVQARQPTRHRSIFMRKTHEY
jgi:hypothetical protein